MSETEFYKTELIPTDKIVLDGDNPNRMSKRSEEGLRQSFDSFGFTQDIVIDKNTLILADGEHRFLELKRRGFKEVPVKMVPFKSDSHRRAYRQAANKLRGEHDEDLDRQEFLRIMADGNRDLLESLRITVPDELQKLIKEKEEPLPKGTRSVEVGDKYLLGDHVLVCGDSTFIENYGEEADMVFTDPPYGVDYEGKTPDQLKIMNDNDAMIFKQVMRTFMQKTKAGGAVYVCSPSGNMFLPFARIYDENAILKQILVWNKNVHVMGRSDYHYKNEFIIYGWKKGVHKYYGDRTQNTVWDFDKPGASREHPTMKPVELVMKAILNSTLAGETVLDPFGGSGSTLIACERTGRKCYTIELDAHYCSVIINRWENETGMKASKIIQQKWETNNT